MSVELPRCSLCRIRIEAGVGAVFGANGKIQHAECPKVVCPVCAREICARDLVRRDGETMVHVNCWIRRVRTEERTTLPAELTAAILGKLQAGTLPRIAPSMVNDRLGVGHICAACGRAVLSSQYEHEAQFANAVIFRFHPTCFEIWDALRLKMSSAASGAASE
jgi:hypothetical protein